MWFIWLFHIRHWLHLVVVLCRKIKQFSREAVKLTLLSITLISWQAEMYVCDARNWVYTLGSWAVFHLILEQQHMKMSFLWTEADFSVLLHPLLATDVHCTILAAWQRRLPSALQTLVNECVWQALFFYIFPLHQSMKNKLLADAVLIVVDLGTFLCFFVAESLLC